MIAASDDGIVVVMRAEDFDWDRFEAEGEDIARRMREVSRKSAERIAELRAERVRYEERAASPSVARETPQSADADARLDRVETRLGGVETRLDRVESRLGGVERTLEGMARDLADIRTRMATTVEVEAVHDSVKMVADGYAQTRSRLAEVSGLLKRYLTTAE